MMNTNVNTNKTNCNGEFNQTLLKLVQGIYTGLYFEEDKQRREYLESFIQGTIKWLIKHHFPSKKCAFKLYYEIRKLLWEVDIEFGTNVADMFKSHVKMALEDMERETSGFDISKIMLNGIIGL